MSAPVAVRSPRIVVLVIDDSEDQLGLMRTLLERAGCDVLVAETGEQGVLCAREHSPNIAVVDLLLPGMTGWQVADQLRAELPMCAIAVSSVLDIDGYPPVDANLPKPVTGAQVRRMLADLVPEWAAQ